MGYWSSNGVVIEDEIDSGEASSSTEQAKGVGGPVYRSKSDMLAFFPIRIWSGSVLAAKVRKFTLKICPA